MIDHEPFPLKHLSLQVLIIGCGLVSCYLIFIGLISVWVGLTYRQLDGSLIPILAGSCSVIAVLWFFVRSTKFILHRMKDKDLINI